MPSFDLRGIKVAKYVNTSGTITYTDKQSIGDAMSVNIALRFAEGRVYAESTLAEYMKKAVGGSISIAEKYIPDGAKKLLFGMTEKSRTVNTKTVKSLVYSSKSEAAYVGVAFYAPAMIDGVEKFECILAKRALFGPPDMVYNTMGESITFQTPTTSGEFLADHSTGADLFEHAVCDSEADAKAWVDAVLA